MACTQETEKKAMYTDVFHKADENGDGQVAPGELKRMFKREYGADVSDTDLVYMFCSLDKNKDGKVTLEEFLNEMLKTPRREAFRQEFEKTDTDKSGYLSRDEIRKMLKDQECGDDAIEQMFANVDVDADGRISLEEFMAMV